MCLTHGISRSEFASIARPSTIRPWDAAGRFSEDGTGSGGFPPSLQASATRGGLLSSMAHWLSPREREGPAGERATLAATSMGRGLLANVSPADALGA